MDWTQIVQMIFGGSIVAGIVEVCAAIRHRKADKVKAEAEAAQASANAQVSDVEAQKAQIDLAELYKEKVLQMVELISTKQDNGTAKQDKMIQMLGNLDTRVDNLESRVANIEGCIDADLKEWIAKKNNNTTNRYGKN